MRFQEAIDAAAVLSGLTGTDAYLEQWHNSPWQSYEGDPEEIAAQLVEELENRYASERLHSLINNKGIE